ncbi:MAG: hypothetical protein OXI26_02410, partial [bacterium]|nr:hypothetical protein [bacterium]
MRRLMKFMIPLVAVALLAAACGDGEDAAPAPAPAAEAPAPAEDAAPAPAADAAPAPAAEDAAPAAPAEEEEVTLSQGESGSAAQAVVSGNLLDEIKDRGTLRVGMVLQFEPQMYIDEN